MRLGVKWSALLMSGAALNGAPAVSAQPSADAAELVLSAEAKRCLLKPAETARALRERASCLSYHAETGILELLRTLAQLDPPGARNEVSWATGKVFEAEVKGRPRAARALEAFIRRPTAADAALQRVTLMALTSLTERRLSRARDESKGKRVDLAPPLACAERVNDAEPVVAFEAQACVGKSNADWPDEALVQAATESAAPGTRHGALKLLAREPKLDEALTRRLAEYLSKQRQNPAEFRDADDVCRILARTTPPEARWASAAAFGWGAEPCPALRKRRSETPPAFLSAFRENVAGGRGMCRTARTAERDYVLLCAFDANHDGSGLAQGELMLQPSAAGQSRPSETTLQVPLLAGERLESKEVRHYYLPEERKPGQPWVDVARGLVVAPVTDRVRGTRRLLVYALHYGGKFVLLWQSPECSGEGCRLDIVQREHAQTRALTGLLLLTDERAVVLDLKALLAQKLDAALGCPLLLGPLEACRALAPTAPR